MKKKEKRKQKSIKLKNETRWPGNEQMEKQAIR